MKSYIYLLFVAIFFTSCLPDDSDINYQTEEDILNYINQNNLIAQKSSTGLYYVIDVEGNGERPTAFSNVTVVYKGYLLDGTVFDESDASGATFNLQQVIPGWTEGITYFKEGGSGKLIIPYQLGYGTRPSDVIPPGSVLVFDVELKSVN